MAQSGYTPIQLYYSTTAAAVPVNTNLVSGELALNIQDEKLYFKNAAGTVKLLASNATSAPVTSFQTSLSGLTPSTATTGVVTLAGTLGTSSGGTNLTSFTSGGVVYASSTSALATGSGLTFDGATLTSSNGSGAAGLIINSTANTPYLRFDQSSSSKFTIGESSIVGGGGAGYYDFYAGASTGQRFFTGAAQRMVLTSAGDVGIGTSSPTVKLDITGYETRLLAPSSGKSISLYADANSSAIGYLSSGFLVFGKTTSTISTQFTEQMRLDSSGNLGLGVTPSAWNSAFKAVQVATFASFAGDTQSTYVSANVYYGSGGWKYIGTGQASNYYQDLGSHVWRTAASGTAGNAISFTQAMTLDASGNLGIGQTSPISALDILGTNTTSYARFWRNDEAGYGGRVGCGNTLYGPATTRSLGLDGFSSISIGIAGTEKIRISSSGGMGLGTTADPGAGAIYATGNITAYYSDARLKTVSGKIENALDKVAQLSGVYYTNNETAKSFGYDSDEVQVGVLAQDVEAVLPQIVKAAPFDLDENNNSKSGENYKTVQYERLVPLLIEAINELRAEVKALKGA